MKQTDSLNFIGKETGATSKLYFENNGTLVFISDTEGAGFRFAPVTVVNGEESPQYFKVTSMDCGDLVFSIYDGTTNTKSEVKLWALRPSVPLTTSDKPARYEISNVSLFLKKANGNKVFEYPTDTRMYTTNVFSENDIKVYYNTSFDVSSTDTTKSITVTALDGADKLRDLMMTYGATAGYISGNTVKLLFKTTDITGRLKPVQNTTTIVRNYRNIQNLPKGAVCMDKYNCGDNRDCLVMNVSDGTQRCYTRAECAKANFDLNSAGAKPESACLIPTGSQEACIDGYDCISGTCSVSSKKCIASNNSCVIDQDCRGNLGVCKAGTCVGNPKDAACVTSVNDCDTGLKCSTGSKRCIKSDVDGACYDDSDCTGTNKFCDRVLKVCKIIPSGENCTESKYCDAGLSCATSTKKCITTNTCVTSEDCSGATNWCDSGDKKCKAPIDTLVKQGNEEDRIVELDNLNTDKIVLVSQNGKYALVLKKDSDLYVYDRDPQTGGLPGSYLWRANGDARGRPPANMGKLRLRFSTKYGGINIDYYNTVRTTWIQVFEQVHGSWSIDFSQIEGWGGDKYLRLDNDGSLQIKETNTNFTVWSSTGLDFRNQKSFRWLRNMSAEAQDDPATWTVLPTGDYSESIKPIMDTVNNALTCAGCTGIITKYIDNVWKYKILKGDMKYIIPSHVSHVYLKNNKDGPFARVNFFEYNNTQFYHGIGADLSAVDIKPGYTAASMEACAQDAWINNDARGFVYYPTSGGCWLKGDTWDRSYANDAFPMPNGGSDRLGFNSGWKKLQTVKSVVYTDAWVNKLVSPSGRYKFECNTNGELTLKDNNTITWSNKVYTGANCKIRIYSGWNGHIVVYNGNNENIWTSTDYTNTNVTQRKLEVGDDGVVRLKTVGTDAVIWDTQNWPTNRIEMNTNQTVDFTSMRQGDYKAIIQSDGKLAIIKISTGGFIWGTPAVGNANNKVYFQQNDLAITNYYWANRRGFSYWPSGNRTLFLTKDGELQMFHGGNLVWSSTQWCPRDYHLNRGQISSWFMIKRYYNSGTSTSASTMCLGIGQGVTASNDTPVRCYNNATPMDNWANWQLVPKSAGDGLYYIKLAGTNWYLATTNNQSSITGNNRLCLVDSGHLTYTVTEFVRSLANPNGSIQSVVYDRGAVWRLWNGTDNYSNYLLHTDGNDPGNQYAPGIVFRGQGEEAIFSTADPLHFTW
jgi:hypothetical protein